MRSLKRGLAVAAAVAGLALVGTQPATAADTSAWTVGGPEADVILTADDLSASADSIEVTPTSLPCHIFGVNVRILPPTDDTVPNGLCFGTPKARLIFQDDGNLVVYDENNHGRWDSGTTGRGVRMRFQSDGNLVIYNINGTAIFASGTAGHPDAFLRIQLDGNVVIYNGNGRALWATGTNH